MRTELWFSRSVVNDQTTVIACAPGPELAQHVKNLLRGAEVDFFVTLPADLIQILEHNQGLEVFLLLTDYQC